jgi:hypothetical protein
LAEVYFTALLFEALSNTLLSPLFLMLAYGDILFLCDSFSRNKIGDVGAKHLADFFLGNNCKQLERLRYYSYSYKI